MSDGLFSPIIDTLGALTIALGGYIMQRHNKRMDGMEEKQVKDHDDLASFKLEASNTYAREAALKRIYELIDQTAKASDIVELRNDIKHLLGARNGH